MAPRKPAKRPTTDNLNANSTATNSVMKRTKALIRQLAGPEVVKRIDWSYVHQVLQKAGLIVTKTPKTSRKRRKEKETLERLANSVIQAFKNWKPTGRVWKERNREEEEEEEPAKVEEPEGQDVDVVQEGPRPKPKKTKKVSIRMEKVKLNGKVIATRATVTDKKGILEVPGDFQDFESLKLKVLGSKRIQERQEEEAKASQIQAQEEEEVKIMSLKQNHEQVEVIENRFVGQMNVKWLSKEEFEDMMELGMETYREQKYEEEAEQAEEELNAALDDLEILFQLQNFSWFNVMTGEKEVQTEFFKEDEDHGLYKNISKKLERQLARENEAASKTYVTSGFFIFKESGKCPNCRCKCGKQKC